MRSSPLPRLKKRKEFLALRDGVKVVSQHMVLAAEQRENGAGGKRVGYTVTKRLLPLAHDRNLVKRRLREVIRLSERVRKTDLSLDFVIIARHGLINLTYSTMAKEFDKAFKRLLKCMRQVYQGGN